MQSVGPGQIPIWRVYIYFCFYYFLALGFCLCYYFSIYLRIPIDGLLVDGGNSYDGHYSEIHVMAYKYNMDVIELFILILCKWAGCWTVVPYTAISNKLAVI